MQLDQISALLAWITPDDATKYHKKLCVQVKSTLEADKKRELCPLYKTKTKPELEKLCRSLKIPVTQAPTKHELVDLISRKRGDPDPVIPILLIQGN